MNLTFSILNFILIIFSFVMTREAENLFDLKRFELLDKIGKGAFGVVYKAREKGKETIYAAKITLQSLDEEENQKDVVLNIVREVNILCKLNHPSIIKFIGFSPTDFEGNCKPVLITEYIPNGSLSNLIKQEKQGLSNPKYNATKKLIIIYGIASAMSYLHAHNIIHRDLKPDNILVDENLYPKIADFGLSKINHQNQDSMSIASTSGIKGTLIYISPEILDDLEFTKEGDIYAFAMVVYEILTTERPFKDHTFKKFILSVSNGERPEIDSSVPDAYRSLIERYWSQKPSDRQPFDEILSDLKENPDFITELVDDGEYFDYVDFIDAYETTYDSERRILTYEEFIKSKKDEAEELFQKYLKFIDGEGVPADVKEASRYCKLAADKGHVDAMFNYGKMLKNGRGVAVNEEEACRYYKMAADKGHINAMFNYGFMLGNGRGVAVNEEEACRYYKMAADKGDTDAMNRYTHLLAKKSPSG